ncbi:MAG: hypothetical protein Q8O04_12745 [Deltaproteobacteria bacterium]|nr:hypothetical protein [Deltaproteobacteria bacterium]
MRFSSMPNDQIRFAAVQRVEVAIAGFLAVIFTYLGVNLLLSGVHAYGSE